MDEYKSVIEAGKTSLYDYVIIAPEVLAESQGMTNLVSYRSSCNSYTKTNYGLVFN